MNTEIMTRKMSPALWRLVANNWIPTELYGEPLFQYLTGEINKEKFVQRTDEIQSIYDGQREPF